METSKLSLVMGLSKLLCLIKELIMKDMLTFTSPISPLPTPTPVNPLFPDLPSGDWNGLSIISLGAQGDGALVPICLLLLVVLGAALYRYFIIQRSAS